MLIWSLFVSCARKRALPPPALVHRDAQLSQLDLGRLDLAHQFVVGLGHVIEGQHAPAEADEEVRAEGNEGPERELCWRGQEGLACRSGDGSDL